MCVCVCAMYFAQWQCTLFFVDKIHFDQIHNVKRAKSSSNYLDKKEYINITLEITHRLNGTKTTAMTTETKTTTIRYQHIKRQRGQWNTTTSEQISHQPDWVRKARQKNTVCTRRGQRIKKNIRRQHKQKKRRKSKSRKRKRRRKNMRSERKKNTMT